jgi:hypothetical protein
MKKINLLLSHENWNSFNNYWIVNILRDFFKVIYIEDDPVFDKADTVAIFGAGGSDWTGKLRDQGYKVVTEQLWNSGELMPLDNSMFLTNTNWFWYSEALCYLSKENEKYIPNRTYKKLALMPMWNEKTHRDLLFDRLTEMRWADSLIYSYVDKGIFLPHDDPMSLTRYNHFDSSWYNDTCFSIVAETRVDLDYLFISEKTYKPIAFYHPFILVAQPKILQHLRSNGFETYENLFDESYDLDLDFNVRFEKIISNIKNYNNVPYDKLTQDKLQHNHDLFFNKDIILERLITEVITPILEYFETKQ